MTCCLAGSAGQNFISSKQEIFITVVGDLKFNFEFHKQLKESSWKYFVQYKLILYQKLFYWSQPRTVSCSSLVALLHVQIVISFSSVIGEPCFISNVFRVDQKSKNLIKSLGLFFAFINEKSSVILKEHKVAPLVTIFARRLIDRKHLFCFFCAFVSHLINGY